MDDNQRMYVNAFSIAGGWKMNKQLWSPSYLFFMAGACGATLSVALALLDYTDCLPRPLRTKWRLPALLAATSDLANRAAEGLP